MRIFGLTKTVGNDSESLYSDNYELLFYGSVVVTSLADYDATMYEHPTYFLHQLPANVHVLQM